MAPRNLHRLEAFGTAWGLSVCVFGTAWGMSVCVCLGGWCRCFNLGWLEYIKFNKAFLSHEFNITQRSFRGGGEGKRQILPLLISPFDVFAGRQRICEVNHGLCASGIHWKAKAGSHTASVIGWNADLFHSLKHVWLLSTA